MIEILMGMFTAFACGGIAGNAYGWHKGWTDANHICDKNHLHAGEAT